MKKHSGLLPFLCLLVVSCSAQTTLDPWRDWPGRQFVDSIIQSVLLTDDYIFACIYDPGLEGSDFGLAFQQKTGKLVLKRSNTKIRWPYYHENAKNYLKGVKFKTYKLRISDSLSVPLIELYQLAVKTARMVDDTCDIIPPIYDAPLFTYYAHNGDSVIIAMDPISGSVCDTSDNVRRFHRVNSAVVQAVRNKDDHYIEEQLSEIKRLIVVFRKLILTNNE